MCWKLESYSDSRSDAFGRAYLKTPSSFLFVVILLLGIALPLTTAEYLPNQTTGVSNASSLQTCGPIEAGAAGMGTPFLPCSAAVQVSVAPGPLGLGDIELPLMLIAAAAIIMITMLVAHQREHAQSKPER